MDFRPEPQSPSLSRDDLPTINRLLGSPLLNDPEKHQLRVMRDSGTKGRFEQEGRCYFRSPGADPV